MPDFLPTLYHSSLPLTNITIRQLIPIYGHDGDESLAASLDATALLGYH